MLKEVDQNIANNMSSDTNSPPITTNNRDHLAIHTTNVYQPTKFSVTTMAASPNRVFLAASRTCLAQGYTNIALSKLDIYDITTKGNPRFVLSIIERENITALAWLNEKHVISVSRQATISVFSLKLGVRTKVITTDYGPITSMKYSAQDNFLITGTEYGYAVGYRIADSGKQIVCDKKMVKINGLIKAIDFHVRPRDVPMQVSVVTEKKKQKPLSSKKRKRPESSEEESGGDNTDQEDDAIVLDEFLATSDITIYGACDNKAVVWDYHKMKILDSVVLENDVSCVLALKNGDFIIGNSDGYIGVYDHVSFTCRQNEKILKSSISCLARDSKNSVVLAAGQEPIITLLKTNASSESQDEYILFERIKDHSARVNCAIFTSKKEFFTCSNDDLIIKFRISRSDGKRKLKRYVLKSNHQSRIIVGINELMTIGGSALHVYNIDADTQFRSELETFPLRQALPAPNRSCTIKTYSYVQAAAFDDKWICYSTDKGVTILDRPGLNRISKPSKDLPNCHILKLCQSGRYLIAGQQQKITITRLDKEITEEEGLDGECSKQANNIGKNGNLHERLFTSDDKARVCETIFVSRLKGMVRDILYQQSDERLLISCGTTAHFLYILQLPKITDGNGEIGSKIDFVHKLSLPSSPLSYLTLNYHDHHDSNLYMYTTKNQLIKCDVRMKSLKTELTKLIEERDSVSNISKDMNIQGIVVLSRNHCLLYGSNHILKLNIDNNEIVNETPEYDNINVVSNTVFRQPEEILIV